MLRILTLFVLRTTRFVVLQRAQCYLCWASDWLAGLKMKLLSALLGVSLGVQCGTVLGEEVKYSPNWHCGHTEAPRAFAQMTLAARVCDRGVMSKAANLSALIGVLAGEQYFENLEEEWGCAASIARLAAKEVNHWAGDQNAYCREVDRVAKGLPIYPALRKKRLVR